MRHELVNQEREVALEELQATPQGILKTAAVVVTYNPTSNLAATVASLKSQVDEVVIVDNGSAAGAQEMIVEVAESAGCHLVINERNRGVGTALNQGMVYASDVGCDLVLLLDQDSVISRSFVNKMRASYMTALSRGASGDASAGMVVPTYIDERSGAAMPLTRHRDGTVLTGMTSGTLIPMTTYRLCGGFEEDFFIDYVDMEYCLRMQERGLVIRQSNEAVLLHSLGRLRTHRIAGVKFSSTNHSAARRYYISRNRTVLHGRYLLGCPEWVGRDLWAMAMETVKIVLAEEDRVKKLWFTARGVFDGLCGRSGYRVAL